MRTAVAITLLAVLGASGWGFAAPGGAGRGLAAQSPAADPGQDRPGREEGRELVFTLELPEPPEALFHRWTTEAEARENPVRSAYGELLERLRGLGDLPDPPPAPEEGPLPILLPVELEVEGRVLRLFTTLTTLGTPQDALLQELRIETFFPADEETEAAVRELAG